MQFSCIIKNNKYICNVVALDKYKYMKIIIVLLLVSNSMFAYFNTPPTNIEKILNSGNGQSIQTAYKVYSVDEEYDLLKYLKLTAIMQTLHVKDGNFYDAIKTSNKTVYFKIVNKKSSKNSKLLVSY